MLENRISIFRKIIRRGTYQAVQDGGCEFLALLLSIAILAIFFNQKVNYETNLARRVINFGLNFTLACNQLIRTGLEAIHRERKLMKSSNKCDLRSCGKFFIAALLLSGDIQLNPGPNWKYPCGICERPVEINQKGAQTSVIIVNVGTT